MSVAKSPAKVVARKPTIPSRKAASGAIVAKSLLGKSATSTLKAATGQWIAFSKSVLHDEPAVRILHIRKGAKAKSMVGAANTLGVSREAIFGLVGLPTSTANRKIAKDETLEIPVTERLARLALVEREAEDTFGDPETAKAWLLSTNTGLGGCTPFSMLDTDVGAREVTKALMAIAYGGVV